MLHQNLESMHRWVSAIDESPREHNSTLPCYHDEQCGNSRSRQQSVPLDHWFEIASGGSHHPGLLLIYKFGGVGENYATVQVVARYSGWLFKGYVFQWHLNHSQMPVGKKHLEVAPISKSCRTDIHENKFGGGPHLIRLWRGSTWAGWVWDQKKPMATIYVIILDWWLIASTNCLAGDECSESGFVLTFSYPHPAVPSLSLLPWHTRNCLQCVGLGGFDLR